MKAEQVVLVGAGGHAISCVDVIEQESTLSILGLIGLDSEIGSAVIGYPVLGNDEMLTSLVQQSVVFLVAVGQLKTAVPRIRLFNTIQALGGVLATVISPHAYVSRHAVIGCGTVVMHGAIVNAGAIIGDNCIVNSNSLVEHEAVIGSHCHISTSSVVNGCAEIGSGSFIGSGAKIREGVLVKPNSLVPMGCCVKFDFP